MFTLTFIVLYSVQLPSNPFLKKKKKRKNSHLHRFVMFAGNKFKMPEIVEFALHRA